MVAHKKTEQVTVPAPVPARTSDAGDPNVSWTVQTKTPFANTDDIPGQIFVTAQLPDPKAQIAAGIDPATANAGLVVLTDEEAKNHPGGPEVTDPLSGPKNYPGTENAGARTAPGATDAPAVTSTVDNVPA